MGSFQAWWCQLWADSRKLETTVPHQNDVSQAWYTVEIHHSGREPSKCSFKANQSLHRYLDEYVYVRCRNIYNLYGNSFREYCAWSSRPSIQFSWQKRLCPPDTAKQIHTTWDSDHETMEPGFKMESTAHMCARMRTLTHTHTHKLI